MTKIFGSKPRNLASRNFDLPGWRYDSQVGHQCPSCQQWLHVMRRPNHEIPKNDGTVAKQTLVALVCAGCGSTFVMKDLGIQGSKAIRRVVPTGTGGAGGAAGGAYPASAAGQVDKHERDRRAQIFAYWRAVEMFAAPALDAFKRSDLWFRPGQGEPAPWESAHDLHHPERWRGPDRSKVELKDEAVWSHTVYGGVYALEQLHRRLEETFGKSGPDVDERIPRGSSALFAVMISGQGRLQLDSLTLSTAAWALGRARNPGPRSADWLDGFGDAAETFRLEVDEKLLDPAVTTTDTRGKEVLQSQVIGSAQLAAMGRLAVRHLGLTGLIDASEIRVHSAQVAKRYQHDNSGVILNSFLLDDLQRVSAEVRAGRCGPALAAYVRSPTAPPLERGDVLQSRDAALVDQLAPGAAPSGRWPAKSVHPLATSQQFAVNIIGGQVPDRPALMGVNGPPGTGKTTMLRELLASFVVQRAEKMANFDEPGAAFGVPVLAWRTSGNVARYVHPVAVVLTGYEIVVASANNEAVANVTREIPGLGAIGDEWSAEAQYFTDHAVRLLGQPAWGLVAAVLGKAANRRDFVNRFWESEKTTRVPETTGASTIPRPPDPPAPAGNGFRAWLDTCVGRPPDRDAWQSAVARFVRAKTKEQALRDQRKTWQRALFVTMPAERAAVAGARSVRVQAQQRLSVATASSIAADVTYAAAAAGRTSADTLVAAHDQLKPGWWSWLVSFGAVTRAWETDGQPLWTTAKGAATAGMKAAAHQRSSAVELQSAQSAQTTAAEALSAAETKYDRVCRELEDAAATCGSALPDDAWRVDRDRSELLGPWLDAEWNSARTRVFLAALDVHEAFIGAAAAPIRTNLDTAMAVLRGTAPPDASPERLQTAWQTLFLVVPSISTTFASVGRLFAGLGSEALGWLLIDEAGQAAPQAAVGAVFRASHVVAVGDPLQLEPIVGALHTTQAALQRHYRVDDFWLPDQLSVQGLADRVTPLGTTLPGPGGTDVWVGAPLVVHRRCDTPIFDLFNVPVYRGLMTYGKPPEAGPLAVRVSCWFDIPSRDADGNWIPAEGVALAKLLRRLLAEGVQRRQVLTISPFRRAATGIREVLGGLSRPGDQLAGGTVHTAQGKEADVVIFVLGGDPDRPGAADWAASKPNLFNVAVSRARQRLFVIGDRSRWSQLPYFRELAVLPVVGEDDLVA